MKDNWISVKDKLPENHKPVIVYDVCYGKIVTVGYKSDWFVGMETYENKDDCDVTHWMPLPDPPKGEEMKTPEENYNEVLEELKKADKIIKKATDFYDYVRIHEELTPEQEIKLWNAIQECGE